MRKFGIRGFSLCAILAVFFLSLAVVSCSKGNKGSSPAVPQTPAGGTQAGTQTPPPKPTTPPWLYLTKTTCQPGEEIKVEFAALESFAGTAWVGIVPSYVEHGKEVINDNHKSVYEALNVRTSGTMTFKAPNYPGSYDLRMNDDDDDAKGKEVASVTFKVEGAEVKPSLKLAKTTFAPDEEFIVEFTAPGFYCMTGWVGIVPSSVEHGNEEFNREKSLSLNHINNKTSGSVTFPGPSDPGLYDIRIFDCMEVGKEMFSLTFTVAAP